MIVRDHSGLFFPGLERGARNAAADLGVPVLVRNVTERTVTDSHGHIQLKLIDSMLAKEVSAVVLVPEPINGLTEPVSLPVPLVVVDHDGSQFLAQASVMTDNFVAGREVALRLAGKLPKGARVVVLRIDPNVATTTAREEGILSVAREKGWAFAEDDFVGSRTRELDDRIAKVLRRYPGGVDAVFAPSEGATDAAIFALCESQPRRRPRLAGFDWKPAFRQALENGTLDFTVLRDPVGMGYRALVMAVAASRDEPIPARVEIDVSIVGRENMNDPAIRAIVSGYEGR